jgi:prepilin-type processing-associated H-X9-DG protein
MDEAKPEMILMYEKPAAYMAKGMPALFFDGHVDAVAWDDLPQAFKETNAFLKDHGKPEVDVGALLKQAGE